MEWQIISVNSRTTLSEVQGLSLLGDLSNSVCVTQQGPLV